MLEAYVPRLGCLGEQRGRVRTMRLSKGGRVGLLIVGLVVLLVGWFLWSIEAEYSALNFMTREVDSEVQVWENEIDWAQTNIWADNPEANTPEVLAAAGGTLVFTGTQADADQYMTERHEGSKNYLVEGVLLAMGALLVVLSLIPAPKPMETEAREAVDSRS